MIWKLILVFHLPPSLEVLVLKMKRKYQIAIHKTSNSSHKVSKYGQILLMNLKRHIISIPLPKQKQNILLQQGNILYKPKYSELPFFVFYHLYLYSKLSLIFQTFSLSTHQTDIRNIVLKQLWGRYII